MARAPARCWPRTRTRSSRPGSPSPWPRRWRAAGLPPTHPGRVGAGLVEALEQALARTGATSLPPDTLRAQAARRLGLPPEALQPGYARLRARGDLVEEELGGERLALLPRLQATERAVAAALQRLLAAAPRGALARRFPGGRATAQRLALAEAVVGPRLAPEQRAALATLLGHGVAVLTGGPGTGKTTLLRVVVAAAHAAGLRLALAAPTGRAAAELQRATGHPAATLHRLLGLGRDGAPVGSPQLPAAIDLLVVDEAAMVGLDLLLRALARLPDGGGALLVGDADQLPPIEGGHPFRDLLESGRVPAARLRAPHRFAAGSPLVQAAHAIVRGRPPLYARGDPAAPLALLEREAPAALAETLARLVARDLADGWGLHPPEIQVLAALYRGPTGIAALNERLRATLNPRWAASGPLYVAGRALAPGDRVVQTANDYAREVWNGLAGTVAAVERHGLVVRFEEREVRYTRAQAEALDLAFATSYHRAQGSETPGVVCVVDRAYQGMLTRPLLYTGVPRAQRVARLLGQEDALLRAVADPGRPRSASLRARLEAALPALPALAPAGPTPLPLDPGPAD